MSAIRHDRRGLRAMQASPYARPAKKSSWSFSNLLSFFNPLRLGSWNDDSASEGSNEGLPISSTSTDVEDFSHITSKQPSASQHNKMQIDHNQSQKPLDPPQDRRFRPSTKTTSPPKKSRTPTFRLGDIDDSSCPAKNIEVVTKFLEERGGNPMSSVELERVISLLRKSAQPEKHQPFRFSFSTSPTPGRSNSPDTVGRHAVSNSETTQPRKMMAKNPNGVYRWRGGGSARPARSRNRYASPAFGPPRNVSDRLILKDNPAAGEGGRTDNKRRRVDDDVTSSPPTKSPVRANGSATAESASSDNSNMISTHSTTSRQGNGLNTQSKINGTTSPFTSLRAPGLPKPTAPAVPSPLRQAWSGSSSDVSTSPVQTPPTPPKPTKAANLMAELIKEVTPPKKPDVSNPYQTASPVKLAPSASKPRPKRTRPSKLAQVEATKTTVDGEMKNDETRVDKITPQAIIEATLPKGSKRARPPAHFETQASSKTVEPIREGTQLSSTKEGRTEALCTVEELDEDEDAKSRISKKPRPDLNGRGIPSERYDVPIVEEVDVEMNGVNEKPAPKVAPLVAPPSIVPAPTAKGMFSHKPSSIPKEPSKLRFSYQPEDPASEASSPSSEVAPETKVEPLPTQIAKSPDPKAIALALSTNSLPIFTFAFAAVSTLALSSDEKSAREYVISRAESSLPSFSFDSKLENDTLASTITPAPVQAFNWSAVGVKPPTAGIDGNWTCSKCMLSNPPSAVEKCTICDEPR